MKNKESGKFVNIFKLILIVENKIMELKIIVLKYIIIVYKLEKGW